MQESKSSFLLALVDMAHACGFNSISMAVSSKDTGAIGAAE